MSNKSKNSWLNRSVLGCDAREGMGNDAEELAEIEPVLMWCSSGLSTHPNPDRSLMFPSHEAPYQRQMSDRRLSLIRALMTHPKRESPFSLFDITKHGSKDWSTNDRSYDPSLFSGKQLEWKGRRCDKNLISYVSLREEIECPRLSLSPRLDLHSFSVLRRDLL